MVPMRLNGQWLCMFACIFTVALGLRVELDPAVEPTVPEMHHYYRMYFADPAFYSLANAGLLNQSDIPDQYREPTSNVPRPNFKKTDFKFNSAKFSSWSSVVFSIIPIEERLALHVYDDSEEMKSATGPQVDQELCSLHLKYMQMMVRKHLVSIRNSTDYSIFRIMHSSDGPDYRTGHSNMMFLGDYDKCVNSKLNVMRNELSLINKTAADVFFEKSQRHEETSLFQRLLASFGPLVGYIVEPRLELLDKHRDKIQLLGMRYCVAAVRYPEWRNDSFSRRNLNLRVAICLPETCDSHSVDVDENREHIKQLLDFNMKHYYADYYLDKLYCLPDEQSELRNPYNFLDSILFICFNVVWLALIALATGVSVYRTRFCEKRGKSSGGAKQSGWWHYLSCWCLSKNYKQFMSIKKTESEDSTQKETNKVDFEPMHGYKVFSAITIMASHVCMIYLINNWNLSEIHNLMSRTWVASTMFIYSAIVDNFFVLTGILTVNSLMRMDRMKLKSKQFWPMFIVYRYLRIVPLWALIHWFVQACFRFLGSGPKWDYGTSRTAWTSICRNESIWNVLIPSANLKTPPRHCNHVGWYLANDLQFCLLVPIFTLIYLRNYFIGHVAIGVTSIVVCLNHIWYYLGVETNARDIYEVSATSYGHQTYLTWPGYVLPQYRCVAFLIGLAAGHVLVRYQRGEISNWPRWFIVGGKLFVAINTYLTCFTPFTFHLVPLTAENERFNLIMGSIMTGSFHSLASISSAIFILLLCTGHHKTIAYFYSLDFLKPLSSMALTSLLVHIPLLYYHSQSLTSLPEVSRYSLITGSIICIVESYALSFIVHLVYEMPLRKILLKIIFASVGDRDDQQRRSSNKLELTESTNGNNIAIKNYS